MKLLLAIVLILLLSVLLTAENTISSSIPDSDESGGHQKTLELLLRKADSGTVNADLYYNIGVCYYQLGNAGKSALYYLRALNLDSSHRQARENLEYLQNLHGDEHRAPQRLFLIMISERIYNWMSLNRLALLCLLFLLLSAACLHWLMHYPREKEKGLPILLLLICVLLLILFTVLSIYKFRRVTNNPMAVIMSPAAQGYSAPGDEKAPLFSLREGFIVHVERSEKGHSLVHLPDGLSGWVQNSDLERVLTLK